jgi:hypothetical protein
MKILFITWWMGLKPGMFETLSITKACNLRWCMSPIQGMMFVI